LKCSDRDAENKRHYEDDCPINVLKSPQHSN
jgi:hypothetical protein